MPITNNHGHYVSFRRTDEELQISKLVNENRELSERLNDLQSKLEEISDKLNNTESSENSE